MRLQTLKQYSSPKGEGYKPCIYWFAFLKKMERNRRFFHCPRYQKTIYPPLKKKLTEATNS